MRKIQKILIGGFLVGVLLGGIGTGMAFVEYSSLAYAGEQKIGAENLVTRSFDHIFQPESGKVIVDCAWWVYERAYGSCIEADDTVPEGTIRYEITYNEEAASPFLVYEELEPDEAGDPDSADTSAGQESVQGRLDVGMRNSVNDFEMWMICKDMVLGDLKQRRISSYDMAYITDIRIKINPATMPYVIDETW